MITLHDTASGSVRPLVTRDPQKVSMYVCGPTVYGPPHLGHGRFSLVFDVLRRYLEWSGYDVTYVSNITDIDDKIIARAADEQRPWSEITEEYEQVWFDAMDAINVRRPDRDPHATAYVEQMVDMIATLVERGSAYVTSDGVYLSVESVEATACWRISRSTTCSPVAESARSSARARSATRRTSCCGSSPSRASPPGPHRGARADRAGTPSAS